MRIAMTSSFFMGCHPSESPLTVLGRAAERMVAEVDGNRTRQWGIAPLTRFEGGGAHQVPGHLRAAT